jgi:CRISPR/Cas system CSM-associated protein Csm3 (group 7 of RAMP superfamily)
MAEARHSDQILELARSGFIRDHVKLSHQGVVDGPRKYDETIVPAGARFTFELTLLSKDQSERDELDVLLSLLQSPAVRLGGATRRGLGAFHIQQFWRGAFDLKHKDERSSWFAWPVSLAEAPSSNALPGTRIAAAAQHVVTASLQLKPEGFWMVGGGLAHRHEHKKPDAHQNSKPNDTGTPYVDRVPFTEHRISWKGNIGEVTSKPLHVLPGSSIKGALKHRTLFHLLSSDGSLFADDPVDNWTERIKKLDHKLAPLFGEIKDESGGNAGGVYIDDVFLTEDPLYGMVQHVSIDRFTQGPMDGLLFVEAPLFRSKSVLNIRVVVDKTNVENGHLMNAFRNAIEDLCEGRLPLGAHASRGYGYFEGQAEWMPGEQAWNGGTP